MQLHPFPFSPSLTCFLKIIQKSLPLSPVPAVEQQCQPCQGLIRGTGALWHLAEGRSVLGQAFAFPPLQGLAAGALRALEIVKH